VRELDPRTAQSRRSDRWYDRGQVILFAFLAAVFVSLAATVLVVIRGIALYRQAKRTGRALSKPLSAFEAKAAEVDRHLDAFETSSRELERARDQLRYSRARLQVLLDAIQRAQNRTRWLRVFLPG
jgi:septal ring factor EnvC (AmiA/AmiB activator)